MDFKLLPLIKNEKGEIRKAGFEIEYAGVDIPAAAQIITDLFGGKIVENNKYFFEVCDTGIGDFSVMIDTRILSEKSYQKVFDAFGIDIETATLGDQPLLPKIETWLESAASKIVPYEITTPPLPVTNLGEIEKLRGALHKKHALGTKAALKYAFGTHINPEIPSGKTAVLLQYLQAFVILYPWLLKALKIDFTRRLTTFINPFPDTYIHKILQPDYHPALDTFIDDYFHDNPNRNRPLDMYPVFAWLHKKKVDQIEGIGKVSGRPTFHYRMPNCSIDDPDWRIAHEWNHWVEVEKLANKPQQLKTLSESYLQMEKDSLFGFENKWYHQIEELIEGK
jgi:hypothetical protein